MNCDVSPEGRHDNFPAAVNDLQLKSLIIGH